MGDLVWLGLILFLSLLVIGYVFLLGDPREEGRP